MLETFKDSGLEPSMAASVERLNVTLGALCQGFTTTVADGEVNINSDPRSLDLVCV